MSTNLIYSPLIFAAGRTMFGKKECFSSIRCSTQAVRASKRPLYPLPTHRRSHIMYRQILSASLTFIKLSRVTISRRVVYSVFIMHRRKDLWGPDGKRLYFLSAFVDLVFPGQLRNLILTASSTIVYTSISHHNHSSSFHSMLVLAFALVNR